MPQETPPIKMGSVDAYASPENAVKIIGECFGFEYYLVAKDKSWLLCENHHNRVIGVGTPVVSAIEKARM
jgi:hypothetical protein